MREDEYEALVTKLENAIADWESEGNEGYRKLAVHILKIVGIDRAEEIARKFKRPTPKS